CFETFSSKYPEADMQGIKVRQYTQLLYDLVHEKKLTFPNTVDKKVGFHDPCYLSKYQNVCEEPREVIKSIGGVELMEFKDNRADSLCCGGGGGRMWADFEAETNRLANIRVTEAVKKGADVLVTACPWCFGNMNDGVTVTNAADKLEVLSLAALCAMAL
ncbi:(Fe-S)-binding protein, partial [Oceanidesulfovibrio marinus]